ncbi:MAG: hypothetical protein KC636_10525, partial [Myxococcales bacterium]|nr:hypothetical protein [Myxococcales bacterium]
MVERSPARSPGRLLRALCSASASLWAGGCAEPCVDDGFLFMQRAASCELETSTSSSDVAPTT